MYTVKKSFLTNDSRMTLLLLNLLKKAKAAIAIQPSSHLLM